MTETKLKADHEKKQAENITLIKQLETENNKLKDQNRLLKLVQNYDSELKTLISDLENQNLSLKKEVQGLKQSQNQAEQQQLKKLEATVLEMKKNILKQRDYDAFLKEKLDESRKAMKKQKEYEIEQQNQISALQNQVQSLKQILDD